MDLSFLSGVFASPFNIVKSLLDIAIVAYIFYQILKLIKGTRAEQLLKGLVLLLIFSALARFLRLDVVNWLLSKLWLVFAITLPIVFQPELRRLLEQIGRGSFLTSSRFVSGADEYRKLIDEICNAVYSLGQMRTGALIIITRETGIGEYIESGVTLDAVVSKSLLMNIFFPNAPLHDGAVVISEGRIYKAGCFLPLSDNPFVDKELGTRHRAALGISEVSDVIAIVVSEETGAVSVAREGELKRFLKQDDLRSLLEKELVPRDSLKAAFYRGWLGEDDAKRQER
ncbi:diadenylate cyclase [Thermosyntropha lipolytica DSM 11003]|uniref:Diadenylate cyclase n=1 Tax=Thermosyntropha lipolytica DSM 11003 TaxID=1123382 RepID=A0A1M5LY43_9FIRM|nr:diadenylate cyclase CdaA [Thermosyntropha lipolytica]SHG69850.1 diadenylate cyclase [Thermosyntropha lipolytica DSM 11003]